MIIRKFEAQTEEEAIRMAREALGPDAVVLTSTPKRTGNWVTRWFRKPMVELVAGKPRPVAETHPTYTSGVFRVPTPVPGTPTPLPTPVRGNHGLFGGSDSTPPPAPARRLRTSSIPQSPGSSPLMRFPGSPASQAPTSPPTGVQAPVGAAPGVPGYPPAQTPTLPLQAGPVPPLQAPNQVPPPAPPLAGSAPHPVAAPIPGAPPAPVPEIPPISPPAGTPAPAAQEGPPLAPGAPPAESHALQRDMEDLKAQMAELTGLKGMLEQVLERQGSELAPAPTPAPKVIQAIEEMPPAPRLPAALRGLLDGLRNGHVDGRLRERVKERLLEALSSEEQRDARAVYRAAVRAIAREIQVGEGLEELARRETDGPLILVLVGPTGVGKTTTLAKLAAGFQFQYGRQAAFVTLDTYRIGAPEQLKQYAEIIDIPIKVVFQPEDLRGAIQEFGDRDVVLIDTVGRSHRNQEDIQDLSRYMACLENAEIQLVLSANTKHQDLREALDVFRDLGVKGLIMTKLDETSSYEDMVNLMVRERFPIHFVTTGQSVPDDIQDARSEEIAKLVTPTPPPARASRPAPTPASEESEATGVEEESRGENEAAFSV